MMTPHPVEGADRLAALRRTALLDTPAEESFDRLTRLAARFLDAPVAMINLIDEGRELCKSVYDPSGRYHAGMQSPLDSSICRLVVADARPLVVGDTERHEVLRDHPAVRAGRVRAYAGVPLITSDGHALGSFCVIHSRPRPWTEEEVQTLSDLAQSVVTEIELRADSALRREAEEALRRSEERFRVMYREAAIGIALVDLAGRPVEANPALVAMLGYTEEELRARVFTEITHPEDVSLDWGLFAGLIRGEREHYRIEKRYLRRDGSIMWGRLTASAIRDDEGLPLFLIGLVEDISEHREVEALRERVEVLEGLLPICMFCKNIRNDDGKWEQLEAYISERSSATFTHGCCRDCALEHFGVDPDG